MCCHVIDFTFEQSVSSPAFLVSHLKVQCECFLVASRGMVAYYNQLNTPHLILLYNGY